MLIKRHDAAQDDGEWRAFLAAHDFGELIASGRGHDVPVVVPTHFIFDGAKEITLHLAKPNPVWERLEQNPLAIVSVFSERRFTSVQACLYGGEAAAVSEREEPAWSAWMQERFPADAG